MADKKVKDIAKNIQQTLNLPQEETKDVAVLDPPSTDVTVYDPEEIELDENEDYKLARENVKETILVGLEGLNSLLKLAEADEDPRSYAAMARLVKSLADSNLILMEIHNKHQDMNGTSPASTDGQTNIDKAVFVGSTKDLQEFLKSSKE
tara:strand:+ start:1080 stop:1529 length:450 start_codon:yes stop_codon:yes gene_type:complete